MEERGWAKEQAAVVSPRSIAFDWGSQYNVVLKQY